MIHPLFTAVAQLTLSIASFEDSPILRDPNIRSRSVAKSLRGVWTVATLVAVASHVSTLTLSLGSLIVPSMFTELYQNMLHPQAIFQPDFFWLETSNVKNITMGAFVFLQWDEIVSCASILVWAFVVNRNSLTGKEGASSFISVVVRTALWMAIGGPAAAAINLIKERDDYMLETVDSNRMTKLPEEGIVTQTTEDQRQGKTFVEETVVVDEDS